MLNRVKDFFNKGNRRSARAKKNIAAMFFLKGVSAVCSLIIVPLTIDYVSKYEYGIWLTISSLVAWLSFFDLGIGNGMRNKVITAIAQGKHRLAKIYVSTSYGIIGLTVSAVWAIAVAASFFVDWSRVLNADASLSGELLWTVIIVLTNFSTLFILGLNRTLLNAIQKPAIASAFDTLTQVLLCAVVWILVKFTDGSLVHLALAMGGTSIFVLVCSNIWTFNGMLKAYRPSIRNIRFRMAKGIMGLGVYFFWIQIIGIAFYQTNNLIITQFLGPDEVTVYNIAYKYMNILTMVFMIVIAPFWSAFAEADVSGDTAWMRNARNKLLRFVGYVCVGGVCMVAISPLFYRLWIGDVVSVPISVTALVCAYHLANIWASLWTQILCGFGKIRLQAIMSTLCCLSYLPMAIWGCLHYGLEGLLVASAISFIIFTSWFGIIQVNKLMDRTASGIWNR